ncbi:MAG: GspE/PulE family protein [Gemmatimonadota bacterium]
MKLGQLLVRKGKLDSEALRAVLAKSESEKCWLGETLVRMGLVSKRDILDALQTQPEFVYDLTTLLQVDPEVARVLPQRVAERIPALVVARVGEELTVAMDDPLDFGATGRLQALTGARIVPVLADRADLFTAIRFHHSHESASTAVVPSEREMPTLLSPGRSRTADSMAEKGELGALVLSPDEEALLPAELLAGVSGESGEGLPSAVHLQNLILHEALRERASDIHIEPQADHLVIRNRVDGRLVESQVMPKWMHAGLVSRFKVLAEMDVSERRLPQDGRCRVNVDGREIDLRVSTLPTLAGEKMVLRILDRHTQLMELEELALEPRQLELVKGLLTHPQGMILVVGPTGSGKTTTLYSLLQRIDTDSLNVVTIEDPIEYQLPGITQVPIRDKIELTFAKVLRSVLRQDPDVILVGEIRDEETAEIAARASVTGHLLFSTLHTNSAVSTVVRLLDLGVTPFMLSSSLLAIISQRLVRRLCHHCAALARPDPAVLRSLHLPVDGQRYLAPSGCAECQGRGYHGRVPIFEILSVTDRFREGVVRGASQGELTRLAEEGGMQTLWEAGMAKVRQGLTSLDEIARAVRETGAPEVSRDARSADAESSRIASPATPALGAGPAPGIVPPNGVAETG